MGVAILLSDKADIESKENYVYAPNRASKYVRQKLLELQGETDKSTMIVEDFYNSLLIIKSSRRQKINKDIIELNSTINQPDLIEFYRIFHPKVEYRFSLSSCGPSTKMDHIHGS